MVFLLLLVSVYLLPVTLADEPKTEEQPTEASQYLYAPIGPPSLPISPYTACNCVLYAKAVLGITEPLGIAGNIKPTYLTPYIGGLVITYEGPLGHVAVITDIKDGLLYLKEANYVHCKITTRTLAVDSPLIKGYK